MEEKKVQTVEDVQVEETVVANGAAIVEEYENKEANTYTQIIKNALKSGSNRVNNVRIKNVNFTEKDNYTMVSFTLDRAIPGYVSNDNGITYEKGFTNVIFTSTYAIAGALKEDVDLGWLANTLLENPKAINLILNGATIDILQTPVEANKPYSNPFSSKNSPATIFDHNTIVNNVIKFKLSDGGKRMADVLAIKLMGF